MDLLTHLFLPITVAYVLRPDLFPSPQYFGLAAFAVLPDVDKLLGVQGALHAPITLAALGVVLLALERWLRRDTTFAALAVALLFSHLLLDFIDGGPVLVLYPLIDTGIGLHFPMELVLGDSLTSIRIQHPLPTLKRFQPTRGAATYKPVNGYGLLSALTFFVIYVGGSFRDSASVFDAPSDEDDS